MTRNRSWITLPVTLLALVSCHRVPDERVLSTTFKEHRTDLLRLIAMSSEDSEYHQIPGGGLPPPNMSSLRFSEYLKIFRSLNFSGPIFRNEECPTAIFIYAHSWVSIQEQPMAVGLVYSPKVALLTVNQIVFPSHLFGMFSKPTPCIAYAPLEKNWYLFVDAGARGHSGLSRPCALLGKGGK